VRVTFPTISHFFILKPILSRVLLVINEGTSAVVVPLGLREQEKEKKK